MEPGAPAQLVACFFRFLLHKPELVQHSACPHPLHGIAWQLRTRMFRPSLSSALRNLQHNASVTGRPTVL